MGLVVVAAVAVARKELAGDNQLLLLDACGWSQRERIIRFAVVDLNE